MKKILFAAILVSGFFLSWACNGPAPYSPGGHYPGGGYPVASTSPTVAATLSPTPAFIGEWGVNSPNGLAAGNGFIYVAQADDETARVQLFDGVSHAAVTQWIGYGTTPFQFPDGVAVNSSGNVYVLDAGTEPNPGAAGAAVYEFGNSSSPTQVTSWKKYGSAYLNNPTGIALDSLGNVYVADSDNFAVEEFGPGGAAIGQWTASFKPAAIALDSTNNIYVVDGDHFVVWKLPSISGAGATSFPILAGSDRFPYYGVAVDSNFNIFIADYYNSLVQVFNNGGTLISVMDGNFGGATAFTGPADLLLSGGDIYVGDYDNGNVQIFGPDNY